MGLTSLLRKARNIGPSVDLPLVGEIAPVDILTGGVTKQADAALPYAQDLFRDVPLAGDLLDAESSADIAARQQQEALGQAQQHQEKMYQEAKGMLSPYQSMGQNILFGTPETQYTTINTPFGERKIPTGVSRSGGLVDRITGGEFVQDGFEFQGERPEFNYQFDQPTYNYRAKQPQYNYSSQVPNYNYTGSGQSADIGYTGSPIDRSIESYMQDDPSLAWQQEQMEKMINRQAAAGGRWGGGGTAREMMHETAGLLSQDYANRFERARLERSADVETESELLKRAIDDLERRNLAEESAYERYGKSYDYSVAREQEMKDRAVEDYGRGLDAEALAYERYGDDYNRRLDADALRYGRAEKDYARDILADDEAYKRQWDTYTSRGTELQNQLNQLTALANYGPAMAQAMANAAIGQGSSLSDLAIQQGNVAANATMAGGNQLAKLLELGGDVAKIAGAAG